MWLSHLPCGEAIYSADKPSIRSGQAILYFGQAIRPQDKPMALWTEHKTHLASRTELRPYELI